MLKLEMPSPSGSDRGCTAGRHALNPAERAAERALRQGWAGIGAALGQSGAREAARLQSSADAGTDSIFCAHPCPFWAACFWALHAGWSHCRRAPAASCHDIASSHHAASSEAVWRHALVRRAGYGRPRLEMLLIRCVGRTGGGDCAAPGRGPQGSDAQGLGRSAIARGGKEELPPPGLGPSRAPRPASATLLLHFPPLHSRFFLPTWPLRGLPGACCPLRCPPGAMACAHMPTCTPTPASGQPSIRANG